MSNASGNENAHEAGLARRAVSSGTPKTFAADNINVHICIPNRACDEWAWLKSETPRYAGSAATWALPPPASLGAGVKMHPVHWRQHICNVTSKNGPCPSHFLFSPLGHWARTFDLSAHVIIGKGYYVT